MLPKKITPTTALSITAQYLELLTVLASSQTLDEKIRFSSCLHCDIQHVKSKAIFCRFLLLILYQKKSTLAEVI